LSTYRPHTRRGEAFRQIRYGLKAEILSRNASPFARRQIRLIRLCPHTRRGEAFRQIRYGLKAEILSRNASPFARRQIRYGLKAEILSRNASPFTAVFQLINHRQFM
jgi:hypothetical protein